MAIPLPSRRFVSVDVLRGLTIAFMILVNDPGDGKHVYAPLDHAEWNGWTPTDLVFPSFLFLVGCSIVFSLDGRLRRGVPKGKLVLQILRRAFFIFLIKMAISAYPHFHLTKLRIYGVLTRIALCYAAAALLYLFSRRWKWIAGITVLLLVGYWMLLRFVPVPAYGWPGHDVPFLDPDGNLVSWVDRGFNNFTQHWLNTGVLYRKTRDPEGLLSTLPAIATTLLGVLSGKLLVRSGEMDARPDGSSVRTSLLFAGLGVASLVLGEIWNISFPINKNLWTSSYVLLAGGWSLLGLALCHWIFDEEKGHERNAFVRRVAWPFLVFGSNAIFAYALSSVLEETLGIIPIHTASGTVSNLWRQIYVGIFARGGSTENTSLAFAIAYVIACFIPTWLLWRRRWFLRV